MSESADCVRNNRVSPVSASPSKGKGRRQGVKTALFRDNNSAAAHRDTKTTLVVWNHNFVPVVVDSKQQSPMKRSPRTSPELSHIQGSPRYVQYGMKVLTSVENVLADIYVFRSVSIG